MTGERGDIVSCDDLDLDIGARVFVSEGDMVSLLALVSKIVNLRFLGGLNGIIEILGVSYDNGYSNPSLNK